VPNLLTPKETEKAYFATYVTADNPYEGARRYIEAGAQAYKEKIEKLADPEKLREAIADCFRIARLEGVLTRYADGKSDADDVIDMLTPYIKQAKQEERERIAKFLNDGGDGMGGWCVGNASCKDTPNSKVDCVKCWQEALKGDKE